MPTMIKIQSVHRDGFTHRPRAGRFWPSAEAITVELLDQEQDFRVEHRDGHFSYDPATTVEVERKNPHNGAMEMKLFPHPTRIGRRAYKQIMGDKVLRVMDADGVSPEAAREAYDAGELEKAKARIADLEAQLWNRPPTATTAA